MGCGQWVWLLFICPAPQRAGEGGGGGDAEATGCGSEREKFDTDTSSGDVRQTLGRGKGERQSTGVLRVFARVCVSVSVLEKICSWQSYDVVFVSVAMDNCAEEENFEA